MTPETLHILMAIGRRPRHGLAIEDDVERRTEGRLRLGPGTLYEAIHRMEALPHSAGWRSVDAQGFLLYRCIPY